MGSVAGEPVVYACAARRQRAADRALIGHADRFEPVPLGIVPDHAMLVKRAMIAARYELETAVLLVRLLERYPKADGAVFCPHMPKCLILVQGRRLPSSRLHHRMIEYELGFRP